MTSRWRMLAGRKTYPSVFAYLQDDDGEAGSSSSPWSLLSAQAWVHSLGGNRSGATGISTIARKRRSFRERDATAAVIIGSSLLASGLIVWVWCSSGLLRGDGETHLDEEGDVTIIWGVHQDHTHYLPPESRS